MRYAIWGRGSDGDAFTQALAREGSDQPSQQLDLETAWAVGFMPGLSEEEEGLLPQGSDEKLYTEVSSPLSFLH